jgi:methionine biosynthesis protein MetW
MNLIKIYKKWETERDKGFLEILEPNPESKVVDLGCGKGDFTLKVKEAVNCHQIYGVDVWEEGLFESGNKGIKAQKMDLNSKLLIPDESFDVVVTNQVIEHLFYPSKFIQEIYRILNKGGYAIISTENLASWDNIVCLLFGYTPFSMQFDQLKIGNRFSPHDKEKMENYPPHVRIFSYQGLVELLKSNGFKIEKIKASGYIPFNFISNADKKHARFTTIKVRKMIE